MSHRKVIEDYYSDINGLVDILGKLVVSYRGLVGGADELNKIALASKSDIKDALDRAEDLGEMIEDIIKNLDIVGSGYINYLKIKSNVIKSQVNTQAVLNEINEELKSK